MSQQQPLQFVVDIVQNPFTIQIICLLGQFIVTTRSTYLLIKNKDKYPIKQNTNILTILILFSFFICNTILLITRIIIQLNLSSKQPSFFQETCCFWHIKSVQYLSYVHLFFSQMLIPSIAFKMFRVSIAYYPVLQKKWIINIMKSRKAIVIGVCIWAGFFTLIQAIFNNTLLLYNEQFNTEKYGGLQLYQFFCAKYPSNLPGSLWLVQFSKTTLTLIIYITQYYFSGIIPQTYNFKWQYNSQFIIFMLPILARNILDMTYTSNLLIWYHTQFFMYYLSTITIAWYHRQIKQVPKNNNPSIKSLQQIKNGQFDQAMHLFQNPQFVKVFRLYLKKYNREAICQFIFMFEREISSLKQIEQRQSHIQGQLENSRYQQKIKQLQELKNSQIKLYQDLIKFQESHLKILRKNQFYIDNSSLMETFKSKITQLSSINKSLFQINRKFKKLQKMDKIHHNRSYFNIKRHLLISANFKSNQIQYLKNIMSNFYKRVKNVHFRFNVYQLHVIRQIGKIKYR